MSMRESRGMGDIDPSKIKKSKRTRQEAKRNKRKAWKFDDIVKR